MEHDLNIWQPLPALDDGFVPHIKRRWLFVGISNGKRCSFPVELVARHPTLADTYRVTAVFAENAWYTPDWVRMTDLRPLNA